MWCCSVSSDINPSDSEHSEASNANVEVSYRRWRTERYGAVSIARDFENIDDIVGPRLSVSHRFIPLTMFDFGSSY